MIIAVVSDTHRSYYDIQQFLVKTSAADLIIHLGDNVVDAELIKENFNGKILSVSGNCDFSSFVPSEKIEIIEGFKFFITHGHKYDVKYNLLGLKDKALEIGANVVLYGHSHISQIVYEEGMWFINPGSAAQPRGGFKSFALINISNSKVDATIRNLS